MSTPSLAYHRTSEIHLFLADYYNQGITPEQVKDTIESMPEPKQYYGWSSACRLTCRPSGINHNWTVRTTMTDPQGIEDLVNSIEWRLRQLLMTNKLKEELTEEVNEG